MFFSLVSRDSGNSTEGSVHSTDSGATQILRRPSIFLDTMKTPSIEEDEDMEARAEDYNNEDSRTTGDEEDDSTTIREEDEDGTSSIDTLREVDEVDEDENGLNERERLELEIANKTKLTRRMFKDEAIKPYELEEAENSLKPDYHRRPSEMVSAGRLRRILCGFQRRPLDGSEG